MTLLKVLQQYLDPRELRPLFIATLCHNFADAGMVVLLNLGVYMRFSEASRWELFLLFVVIFAVAIIISRYRRNLLGQHLDGLGVGFQRRIIRRLQNLELLRFEGLSRDSLFASLVNDTRTVMDSVEVLFLASTAVGYILFLLLFLALLWPLAGLLTVVWMLLATSVFITLMAMATHAEDQARQGESALFAQVRQLISGFKDIKLQPLKASALETLGILPWEQQYLSHRLKSARYFSMALIQSELTLILAAALLVFGLGQLPGVSSSLLNLGMLTVLAMPMGLLMELPIANRTAAALLRLQRTQTDLGNVTQPPPPATTPIPFTQLSLRDVGFRYPSAGDSHFAVGPIHFTVEAATITFIVGGNGSGKSTLVKVLTGLYPCDHGEIWLNGQPVDMAVHRGLFGGIFVDSVVFDRLYGLTDVDVEAVNRRIETLGLADKTRFEEGRFTNLKLSTGQLKRLAMAVSLTEDRQVFVLDEWAADQDPEFREYYYRVLLPELKAQGKTIIAVSHDDRYFEVADQLIKLEFGRQLSD